jgi:hypothetical protein
MILSDIKLSISHVSYHLGKKIHFFSYSDGQQGNVFYSESLIQGVFRDVFNDFRLTIFATLVQGECLNGCYADEDGFIRDPENPGKNYFLTYQ